MADITTAAELDALPVGSVVSFTIRLSRADRSTVANKRACGRWYLTGMFRADGYGYTATDLLEEAIGSRVYVLRPAATPSIDQIAAVLAVSDAETFGYERRARDIEGPAGYLADARAVASLFALAADLPSLDLGIPDAYSRKRVARILYRRFGGNRVAAWGDLGSKSRKPYLKTARAILKVVAANG